LERESPNGLRAWLVPLLLVLAGGLAYLNTLPNGFVFDDDPWIVNNERIRDLSNLGDILTATNRPVMDLSFALNYAVGGTDPVGYHLANMAIHILAALVLYGLARRTLSLPVFGERVRGGAVGLAGVIAAIWLLHPLNTQAVTYTVQRGESLMGLCYLFTLYSFVRYATGEGRWWAVSAVVACVIGAGCKEVIATAPLVVVLYDFTFIRQPLRETIRRRGLMYLGLFAMWLPLGWMVYRTLAGGEDASAGFALEDKLLSRWTYLLAQPQVIVEVYLRKAFWPNPLVLDYQWVPAIPQDTPAGEVSRLFISNVLWQGLVVVGLLLTSAWGVFKRTWWGFLGLSFFLILAPTSSIMPIADLAVEHRMYLSLIAVVCVVVVGVYALLSSALPDGKPAVYGLVLAGVVAMSLGLSTAARNTDYRSKVAIWDSVVLARPYNARGWHNLASALDSEGRSDEAMLCYEQVLKIIPTHAAAYYGIGNLWLKRGNLTKAIDRLQTAVQLKPDDTASHAHLGKALLLAGQLDLAEASLRRAIELDPTYARAREYLGLLHLAQKDLEAAIESFRLAVEYDPALIAPRQNLATSLAQAGRPGEASLVIDQALAQADTLGLTEDELKSLRQKRDRYLAQAGQGSVGP
jgi:protein O-mannosyl-transferase